MAKKRVHEIARAHGLTAKELLVKLHDAGIEAKAASSTVEEDAALRVLAPNGASANGGESAATATAVPPRARPRESEPAPPAPEPVAPAAPPAPEAPAAAVDADGEPVAEL